MASSEDGGSPERSSEPMASPVNSVSSDRHSLNIQSLAFIVHPSHECCTPEEDHDKPGTATDVNSNGDAGLLASARSALGLSQDLVDSL